MAGSVLLAALAAAPGAAGGSAKASAYPFLNGYHLMGTPLALAFFDGGPVGRVAVLFEYNLKGIVPNSYAGVITSSFHVEVQADTKRVLHAVTVLPRPAQPAQVQPDLTQFVLGPLSFTEKPANSPILDDLDTATKVDFESFSGGTSVIATGPHVLAAGDTDGFQLYYDPKRMIGELDTLVGDERRKQDEPPLTPNLDKFIAAVSSARTDEEEAAKDYDAIQTGGGEAFGKEMGKARGALVAAVPALKRAFEQGELAPFSHKAENPGYGLAQALVLDKDALDPLGRHPALKNEPEALHKVVLGDLKRADGIKQKIVQLMLKQAAAREQGK